MSSRVARGPGTGAGGKPLCKREHAAVAKGTLALSREAANGCISQGLAPGGSRQGYEQRQGKCCTCLGINIPLSNDERTWR